MAFSKTKNSKFLIWLLSASLAFIWGEIGYRLFFAAPSAVPATTRHTTKLSHSQHSMPHPYVFKDNVRDPFALYAPAPPMSKRKKHISLIVHIWTPPPLYLEGVILGEGKRTAIVAALDGNTSFMVAGDTLQGLRIIQIDDKRVEYTYSHKDTSWSVPR